MVDLLIMFKIASIDLSRSKYVCPQLRKKCLNYGQDIWLTVLYMALCGLNAYDIYFFCHDLRVRNFRK
jgi:hypothetical protein